MPPHADPDPGSDPADHRPARPAPRDCRELFWSFTWLALQGFGGVLAVVQRELVDRKGWLTNEEFIEDWAVAQILPGPNVVNLAVMVGDRYFGWRGALSALAGMLLLPLLVLLCLAVAYARFSTHPAVAGALRGMGAVAAGLVAGVALRMAVALRTHPLGAAGGAALAALTFVAMAVLQWPLAVVLLAIGGAACALTWRKLPA
ncbi:Chromate transporter [Paracidovorax avenae ATCC 19860]|uniref:Chromate transporter n=1 Tax=Paracidovorax avenae (strain ATCC 19860 / DSM 7227 / CCUG 15838 / JCM 20985 / LMG 2117 / NCPPB 1011) TaxID=643561 RepID=F0QC92_PARA1|nr:chromate transporter [Paracidovorax avenae]ADX46183.1 Chromate transporter [Paracidovorax avenae ATCC 19860]